MSTARTLRKLWRLRRYVAGVCVLAVLAGAYLTTSSRSYDVGLATARVLVDTPRSQVVGVASSVSAGGGQVLGTLGTQANLLAGLMVEGTIKTDIAQRAGLQTSQLFGNSATLTTPVASGSASASGPATVTVPSGPNVFSMTTQILAASDGQNTLPIIEIDTQAPNRDAAVRLASAAVAGLQAFVASEAANERIAQADRLSIMNLGVLQASTQTRGSSPSIGVLGALAVLLLGCASILWAQAVIRGWRSAAERERLGIAEPLEDETEWTHEPASTVDRAPGPVIAANAVLRAHVPTNGHVAANGHAPANGVAGTPDHGPLAAGFRSDATAGRDLPSTDQWASRKWSSHRTWLARGDGSLRRPNTSSDNPTLEHNA